MMSVISIFCWYVCLLVYTTVCTLLYFSPMIIISSAVIYYLLIMVGKLFERWRKKQESF